MAADVVASNPVAVNDRVRTPSRPVMLSPLKTARPAASVATTVDPPRTPPPDAIAADTATPACARTPPAASRNCTTGCWASTCPLRAVAEGCTVSESDGGAVSVRRIGLELTAESPDALKLRVWLPTAPLMDTSVNVATPSAAVTCTRVPSSVPVPLPSETVMATPDWDTGLPLASTRRTRGC